MHRRAFLKSGAALPVAAMSGLPGLAGADAKSDAAAAPWRVFEVVTQVEVEPAGVTRVWLPVPLTADTDYFKNLGATWSAEGGTVRHVQDPKYKAGIVAAEFPAGAPKPQLKVTNRFATQDRAVDFGKPGQAVKENPAELKLALAPTDLLPTDGLVRDTARDIIKGQRNDIDKARAIYEWIVDNTFRDPKVRGCGWGDIQTMLETRNFGGKCGDLNALFVALSRSVGIPARDVYGIRVAKSRKGYVSLGANTEVISKAQHCRAEFYTEAYGWIPVDPADVRKVVLEEPPGNLPMNDAKVRAARERLFGAWEMNWLAYNYAHDLALPGAAGPRIPYLMYPTGETAQGRLDSLEPDAFKYVITSKEIALA
jgi:transglutaminase-like putative cysteine protease